MGHLVEAIKKLDQKRAAERPKPARRTDAVQRPAAMRPKPARRPPAARHAAKAWRLDEPHPIVAAHYRGEPHVTDKTELAVIPRRPEEIQSADAPRMPPHTAPESTIGAPPETQSAASEWRFPAPAVPSKYHNLAASLVGQRTSSAARPHSVLLTAVSSAAVDAVSVAALVAVLSSQGNVLWIDTRNVRPTPAAVGPPQVKIPGWNELRTGQATWDEIITPTSLTGISFVGRGEWAPEGNGPEFDQQLFEPLRCAFSFVLIDGGAVEKSASLASFCSVTGLVVALGHARRSQVDRALRMLDVAGARRPLIIAVEPHRLA